MAATINNGISVTQNNVLKIINRLNWENILPGNIRIEKKIAAAGE